MMKVRLLFLAFVCVFSFSSTASAAIFVADAQADLPDQYEENLYVGAETVIFRGQADENVFLMGGRVDVSGDIQGDVFILGGDVSLSGTIRGDVKILAMRTVLDAYDGEGELMLYGQSLSISPLARHIGSIFVSAQHVVFAGHIEGKQAVFAAGDYMEVSGTIISDEPSLLEALTVEFNSGAFLDGDAHIRTFELLGMDETMISGTLERTQIFEQPPVTLLDFISYVGLLFATIVLIGIPLILSMPAALVARASWLRGRPGGTLLTGVVWVLGMPVLIILAFISGFGILFSLFLFSIYAAVMLASVTMFATSVGLSLLRKQDDDRFTVFQGLLVGGCIVALLIAMPTIGLPTLILAMTFGAGSILQNETSYFGCIPKRSRE